MYGGERSSSSARADGAEPDEDDDECEPISDVCTLDALAHFWVTLPMDGARTESDTGGAASKTWDIHELWAYHQQVYIVSDALWSNMKNATSATHWSPTPITNGNAVAIPSVIGSTRPLQDVSSMHGGFPIRVCMRMFADVLCMRPALTWGTSQAALGFLRQTYPLISVICPTQFCMLHIPMNGICNDVLCLHDHLYIPGICTCAGMHASKHASSGRLLGCADMHDILQYLGGDDRC